MLYNLKRKFPEHIQDMQKREEPNQDYLLHFKLKLYENKPAAPLEGSNNATILIGHFSLAGSPAW